MRQSIKTFIHPYSSTYLGPGRGGSRQSEVVQTSLSPAMFSSSSWGILRCSQTRWDTQYISPSCSGSTMGSPTSWTYPENLQKKTDPDQLPETPQLAPFDAKKQQLYSGLPPDAWAPYPVSKGEHSHPTEETHFGFLYPQCHSFGHYPKLVTICVVSNVDLLYNRKLSLTAFLLGHQLTLSDLEMLIIIQTWQSPTQFSSLLFHWGKFGSTQWNCVWLSLMDSSHFA